VAAAEEEAPPSLVVDDSPAGGENVAVSITHTQLALRRGFF